MARLTFPEAIQFANAHAHGTVSFITLEGPLTVTAMMLVGFVDITNPIVDFVSFE